MMVLEWIPLFLFCSLLEALGQLAFKKCALASSSLAGINYYLSLFKNIYLFMGISLFLMEFIAWVFILRHLPLNIAFPLTGIQQLIVIFFSCIFLKEKINFAQWIGVGMIVMGIILLE
ncbi:EamA family transporter [Legionella sp. 227]|uniref:EamA family transporter n=1 Tax=Legionella sp. 227 TaxID=3367288 RepID=UPI00370D4A47